MKGSNMGIADRVIRLFAGIILVDLAVSDTLSGVAGWLAWIVAVIFIITAAIGWCPVYLLLGISTKANRKTN